MLLAGCLSLTVAAALAYEKLFFGVFDQVYVYGDLYQWILPSTTGREKLNLASSYYVA